MKCSFCSVSLYSYLYNCCCDEFVISCRACCQYGCYQCKAPLQKVELKMCRKCHQYKMPKYMFGDKYDVYCHQCCLKQYEKASGKKVILSTYTLEPEKYQLYCYLKKYCFTCSNFLPKDGIENYSPGLKQIYPLHNNICQKCIQNTIKSGAQPQVKSSKISEQHKNLTQTSSQSKSSRYVPKDLKASSKIKDSNQKGKEEAEQKWKRVQQSPYIKCMACNRMIIGDGTVNQDVAICSTCTRGSNLEQTLNNSRIKPNIFNQNRSPREINSDSKGIVQKGYNVIQNTKNQSSARGESPKVYQYRGNSKTPEKINPQNSSKRVPVFPPKKQSSLKKSDSEARLENVPINIQLINEQQLVQCSKCGIRLEAVSAIWEENDNVPMCRCCYTDLLEQLQREAKQKDREEANTTKYRKYVEKKQEVPRNQKASTSEKKQNEPSRVTQRRTELKNSPSFGINKQASPQKDSQPVIKQEIKKEPLNKVKRTESWDDAIIVQPVADHERRKRQKKLSQQQKNKINEQPQQYAHSEQQQQKGNSKYSKDKDNQPNNINLSKTNKRQNLDSHEKDRSVKQESIEPIIIDDEEEEQSKRIQKSQSWNEKIILQPLDSTKNKKAKSSVPESSEKQLLNKKQQPKLKQQIGNDMKNNINKKQNQKQQTQPIIQEQNNEKKFSVNRLTSWNDEIILEPVADHERRKRQKLRQQYEVSQDNIDNINNNNSNIKANKNSQIPFEKGSNQRSTHSQAKLRQQSENRPHTSNEYRRTNVTNQYDYLNRKYKEQTQKLRQTNANTSAYTAKEPPRGGSINNNTYYTSNKSSQNPTNSYHATSQPHTPTRQNDNYNKREQFSRYFKGQQNQNRSQQKKNQYFNRSPSFKQRFDEHFNNRSPYSSNFYRDEDFDRFFSDTDHRFNARFDQPFFSQSQTTRQRFPEMNIPYSNTNSDTKNETFVRQTGENQKGMKNICGHCNQQFSISSRNYRINGVTVCLGCYGEWNRNSKSTRMPTNSYFY